MEKERKRNEEAVDQEKKRTIQNKTKYEKKIWVIMRKKQQR